MPKVIKHDHMISKVKVTTDDHMISKVKVTTDDHMISKVRSLKQFAETPPLVPITFDKSSEFNASQLSLEWFKEHYEPHL
jgi:hypothetical protein